MSLTKSDLSSIRTVVKSELEPIKNDIETLKKGQSSLEKDVSSLKESVETLKKGQRKTNSELNQWTKFFDRDYVQVKKDVKVIKDHLNLPVSGL